MEAKIVSKATYDKEVRNLTCVFNTSDFVELNKSKVDCIRYIIIYKGLSPRFACVFGETEGEWRCPFSAPFGYIEPIKKGQSISNYEQALTAVERLAYEKGCRKIMITLPPSFYDSNVIDSWCVLMLNNGWKEQYVDISFGLNIEKMAENYESFIEYNARKNLKIALKSELNIRECVTEFEKREAYKIIKKNREYKGYPLRMSESQVMETINVVPAKLFIVNDGEKNIASALVYDVTSDKAQIIYWGDIPEVTEKKAINYLGYELSKIYLERGFSWLDIGPSTEEGVPNYGLCNFKDSIGCQRTAKFRLFKNFREPEDKI